jgi:ubiquinone/menaquinone biosynthesis C-methylase UbiE
MCHPRDVVPDVWASVGDLDTATQERLADVLETRGEDAQQQAMRRAFLREVDVPSGASVLDVGCGTGVLTRELARHDRVASVVGVDTAPSLLARARELAADVKGLRFEEGDARALPFDDAVFDVVVFDSTLSHVLGAEEAVAEAFRVLRPSGIIAAFDGDYATATVAITDADPLQACVDAMMSSSVTDRRLVRRLPAILRRGGFEVLSFRSYGFAETAEGAYMLSVVDRGADLLLSRGDIAEKTATALKAEARRRVRDGVFFGHIAYASVVGRRGG